jgi:hypothetical protein
MALTYSEKQRVLEMLDRIDRSRLQGILDSFTAFCNWLSDVAYSIYQKIRDGLRTLWDWICDIFS